MLCPTAFVPHRHASRSEQPLIVFLHRRLDRRTESPLVFASYGTSPSAPVSPRGAISSTPDCATPPRRMRVSLITSFPPSPGDLNEYGYHLACAMRNDPRVDLKILADEAGAQKELFGFPVER